MKAFLKMIKKMEMEFSIILMEIDIKAYLKMDIIKEMEYFFSIMEIDMKENSIKINMKEMVNNKYEGNGKYFYHNGDKFEGLWKDDKKNGKGTYIYLNGDTISGNYKNGKPIGIHFKLNAKGKMTQIKYSDDI